MARTNAENCLILCETYDALLDAYAAAPTGPIEITIRGRTVRYPDPGKALESLEKAISRCQARAAADEASSQKRSARNQVKIVRDTGYVHREYC